MLVYSDVMFSMLLFSQYFHSCVMVPHEACHIMQNVLVADTICYLYHLIAPATDVLYRVCISSPVSVLVLDHDCTADQ